MSDEGEWLRRIHVRHMCSLLVRSTHFSLVKWANIHPQQPILVLCNDKLFKKYILLFISSNNTIIIHTVVDVVLSNNNIAIER